jgi:hypothetical protein
MTTPPPVPGERIVLQENEPTVGRLVADVSRDVSTLVRHEIALAKSELKFSVKAGGLGAALFGAAAFLGLLAVIMVSFAIAYFFHFLGLDLAWCFLIVFGIYLFLAGLLSLVGIRKLKQVHGPERAIHQAQETKGVLKHG